MSVPGLDLAQLGSWLSRELETVRDDLTASLIQGGNSNLTYEVTDGTSAWIVRRPPLGHVLATAHDMTREFTVMSALFATAVPVARPLLLCEEPDVLGAPFYVMEKVDGRPFRYIDDIAPAGPERTRGISESLVDALSTLHEIAPDQVGLSDFGHPEGFLRRQVRRWNHQLEASRSRDLPAADKLCALLAADVPPESATAIVHGDYRLDNVLFDDADRLVAVVDWEMATLGDPLTDLALMVVYARLGHALPGVVADAPCAPGYLTESEILTRYADRSSVDLTNFGFYIGLASYKLAAILEGIHYRQLQGRSVGVGFAGVGDVVEPLLVAGLKAIQESN